MSGTVTVSFDSNVSSEDEAKALVADATRRLKDAWLYEDEMRDLKVVSFVEDVTITLTHVELDARINAAVEKALAGARSSLA